VIRKNKYTNFIKEYWIVLVPYVVLLILTVIMAVINPRTLSMRFLANKSDALFSLILVSIGQTFVLISGGFDLSVGGVICVTNSLLALNMGNTPGGILFWSFMCIIIGAGIGIFNGIMIEKAKMQPFIVTLATQSACYGTALLILKVDGGRVDPAFMKILMYRFGEMPLTMILTLLLICIWLYMKRTPFGLALYAIGSNEKAAHLNSVNVLKTKIMAYGLSGLFAGIAGIYRTAHMASGSPTAGSSFVMTSIVAAVIGGTAITGGIGGIVGTIAGAYLLRNITDLLVFLKVSASWTSLAQGILLVVAVALTSYAKLRRTNEVAQ
jgi:ribose transport system permease protein